MIALLRNGALTYRGVGERGEPYPEWLRRYRGASGVYVIRDRDTREVLYVGESHSRRLYETLTRHFQRWRRKKQFWHGLFSKADPGRVYDREHCTVAVVVCPAGDAIDRQYRAIQRARPRDNQIDGDGVPF